MNYFSLAIFWTCISYAVYHFLWAAWFRWMLPKSRFPENPEFQPQASVILSLRGKDPFVADTIRNLLQQEYNDYELRIIVDSESDPVWESLKEFSDHPRIRISILEDRLKTCSLKCSAIVQALREVPDNTKIIALVDADISPRKQWLKKMVSPLENPEVGVVTGNQWFSPMENRVGSLIRSLWNSAALVVTFLFRHTWAGSCARRLTDIQNSGLIEQWQTTIVDDGPIDGAMRKLKIKTVFAADLITVNREECDFPFSIVYNSRMLTWSRIYEWGFLVTLGHMLFTVAMVVAAMWMVCWNLINQHSGTAVMLLTGLLTVQLMLLAAFVLAESAIKSLGPQIANQVTKMTVFRLGKIALLIPVALVVYSISTVKASFAKKIKWRNATYEIRNRFEVKVIDDKPFSAGSMPIDQTSSI